MSTEAPQIADHPERHRYELTLDGKLAARIEYRLKDGHLVDLIHTEVDPAFEGRGLAGKIATFALDDARTQGRKVIATCEYIQRFLQKHPEYQDLAAAR